MDGGNHTGLHLMSVQFVGFLDLIIDAFLFCTQWSFVTGIDKNNTWEAFGRATFPPKTTITPLWASLGREDPPTLFLPAHTGCEVTPNPTKKYPCGETIAKPRTNQELCRHIYIHQMHLLEGKRPVIRLHCNLQEKLLFDDKND